MNQPLFTVIIPALDPDERLCQLVQDLHGSGVERIIVVDDGSSAEYANIFTDLEDSHICTLLRHPTNRGKGAALKTAMLYALDHFENLTGCVTADADGQHSLADILKIAWAMEAFPQRLVLGVRDFTGKDVPWKSRWGNRITSFVFRLQSGLKCPDTQTGLRGMSAALMRLFSETPGDRYEYEMNMLMEAAKAHILLQYEPIRTIYSDNNSSSHFHPFRDSLRIYANILKFGASSLISAFFDVLAFTLLADFAFTPLANGVFIASICARVFSGGINYFINKHVVFGDRKRTRESAPKYAALFVGIMLASSALTELMSALPLPITIDKIIVDVSLFSISYLVQKRIIFHEKKARRGLLGGAAAKR